MPPVTTAYLHRVLQTGKNFLCHAPDIGNYGSSLLHAWFSELFGLKSVGHHRCKPHSFSICLKPIWIKPSKETFKLRGFHILFPLKTTHSLSKVIFLQTIISYSFHLSKIKQTWQNPPSDVSLEPYTFETRQNKRLHCKCCCCFFIFLLLNHMSSQRLAIGNGCPNHDNDNEGCYNNETCRIHSARCKLKRH